MITAQSQAALARGAPRRREPPARGRLALLRGGGGPVQARGGDPGPRGEAGGDLAVGVRRGAAPRELRRRDWIAARGRVTEFAFEPWVTARRAGLDALLAARLPQPARADDP